MGVLPGHAVGGDSGRDTREPRQQRHDASGHRRVIGEDEVRAAQVPDDAAHAGEPTGERAEEIRVIEPRHDHVGANRRNSLTSRTKEARARGAAHAQDVHLDAVAPKLCTVKAFVGEGDHHVPDRVLAAARRDQVEDALSPAGAQRGDDVCDGCQTVVSQGAAADAALGPMCYIPWALLRSTGRA